MTTKINATISKLLYAAVNIPKPVTDENNVQSLVNEDLYKQTDAPNNNQHNNIENNSITNNNNHTSNQIIQLKKYLKTDFFETNETPTTHIQSQTNNQQQTVLNENSDSLTSTTTSLSIIEQLLSLSTIEQPPTPSVINDIPLPVVNINIDNLSQSHQDHIVLHDEISKKQQRNKRNYQQHILKKPITNDSWLGLINGDA